MNNPFVLILGDLAHARQSFVRRHQMAPFHRFFENEALYLGLVRDLLRQPPAPPPPVRSALDQSLTDQWASVLLTELLRTPMGATIVTGTGGTGRTNVWDPVFVVPSRAEISAALVPLEQTAGRICCICQEGMSRDAVQLRGCNHPFHQSCIEQWFSQSPRCPVCRNDIRTAATSNTNVLPTNPHTEPSTPVGTGQDVRDTPDSAEGGNHVAHP